MNKEKMEEAIKHAIKESNKDQKALVDEHDGIKLKGVAYCSKEINKTRSQHRATKTIP